MVVASAYAPPVSGKPTYKAKAVVYRTIDELQAKCTANDFLIIGGDMNARWYQQLELQSL